MKKNLLKRVKKLVATISAAAMMLCVPQSVMAITVTDTVIWAPDPVAYVQPDGNCRYYSQSELYEYSNLYLLIARNEYYARHGYIFQDQNIARYFECKNWYYGTTTSQSVAESSFNAYERANLNTIISEERRRGSTQMTIPWTTDSGSYNTGSYYPTTGTTIDVTQTIIWAPEPNASVIPDVAARYISSSELSNFSNLYLLIARNEIYAKHGYSFKDQNIARYFRCKNWYCETTTSQSVAESSFNVYERANLDTIINEERRRGSTQTTIPWTN